jgi:hypothetical protein
MIFRDPSALSASSELNRIAKKNAPGESKGFFPARAGGHAVVFLFAI